MSFADAPDGAFMEPMAASAGTSEKATGPATATECGAERVQAQPGRIRWARLLERVFDIDCSEARTAAAGS